MTTENPSIISHVSLGTNNFEKSRAFYEKVLATLGAKVIMEHPGAVAFGKQYPEFWVQAPFDGGKAEIANGVHFGFVAQSKAEVDAFHKAAIAAGGKDDGKPGGRSDYGEPYYGGFIRDLDGHKIEAAFWDEELAKKLGMG
jgi:catechol 2,3-dioxygenase-like lactoylglutathione lyase family enzyme